GAEYGPGTDGDAAAQLMRVLGHRFGDHVEEIAAGGGAARSGGRGRAGGGAAAGLYPHSPDLPGAGPEPGPGGGGARRQVVAEQVLQCVRDPRGQGDDHARVGAGRDGRGGGSGCMKTSPLQSHGMPARVAALQMLYALELGGQDAQQVERWYVEAHPLAPPVRERAGAAVEAVVRPVQRLAAKFSQPEAVSFVGGLIEAMARDLRHAGAGAPVIGS